LITEVDLAVAEPDTFFPEFAEADWQRLGETKLRPADPACVMVEYLRRITTG
jgi:dihydrofolate reductase